MRRSPTTAGPRSRPTRTREPQASLYPARQGRPPGRRSTSAPSAWSRTARFAGHPGRDPRHQRPGPPRERAAPPGRRAGRRRGARPPRPRAARLGHPGAVLDDPGVPLGRDAARPRPGRARAQLGQLRELQREALAEMRALIFELRPGNLEQDGLVRALKTHTAALQGRLGLPIVVESDLDGAPAAAGRGGALPDRPGGPPQRRQARRRPAGPGRASDRMKAASGCASRTTARASIPTACRTGTSASPACAPERTGSARRFTCSSKPGEGTTIEVVMDADVLGWTGRGDRDAACDGRARRRVHPRRMT